MTTVEDHRTDLAPYVLVAAEAAAGALPAEAGWQAAPAADDIPVPDPACRAVLAPLDGGAAVMLLIEPGLARRLQVGPPPAEDLLDGVGPAMAAIAAALVPAVGSGTAGEPVEVEVGTVPEGQLSGAVLLDGDRHLVTLVVAVPLPATDGAGDAGEPMAFEPLTPGPGLEGIASGLELLHDVEMGVTVELGRARMLVRDVLGLAPGSVIELDRAAGSPVDVLVNGTLIARGEVVVIDEEFGIRITEVVGHRPDRSSNQG